MRDIYSRAEQSRRAARIEPKALLDYAQGRGWRQVREYPGSVLLGFQPHTKAQLLIPLDPKDPNYVDAVLDVLQRLINHEHRSFDAIVFDIDRNLASPEVLKERERIAEWVEDIDEVYLGIFKGHCRKGEYDDLHDGLREIARRIREGKAHL